jgi:hypothetical protein
VRDFDVVFVDDVGDGSYEVGIESIFKKGRYGETLFVRLNDAKWVISGDRTGLEGP